MEHFAKEMSNMILNHGILQNGLLTAKRY